MDRPILGESPVIKDLLKMINKVAAAKTNVLIVGESGTGKELVARMLHESGPLKGKAFVPVNCGAIPENLIESEFFGHRKGSFTGAISEKAGLFEVASGGTLFLDEVGEIPLSMQVKLLRAIQERAIRKVGGTDDIRVDARIIAATNRDLQAEVHAGRFREDLFYRLNVIQIRTPPLRERKGDVRLLVDHFLSRFAARQNRKTEGFEPQALQALENHSWPGNVRELENVVERAITLSAGGKIPVDALPAVIGTAAKAGPNHAGTVVNGSREDPASQIKLPAADFSRGKIDLDAILGGVEKAYLLAALEHSQGVKKAAAALLGITFRSIRYRLNKLGIETSDEAGSAPSQKKTDKKSHKPK